MSSSLHSPAYTVFRTMLARVRAERGVTQTELAGILRCPQSLISKVERGERRLDFPEFVAWADALNVDVARFVKDYRRSLGPRDLSKWGRRSPAR